jgi:ankyrin repeat protein
VKGHCDVVECLLSSGGDINLRNEDGHSPLFAASSKGESDVVKHLLSSGADINLCDKEGQSPLLRASMIMKSTQRKRFIYRIICRKLILIKEDV